MKEKCVHLEIDPENVVVLKYNNFTPVGSRHRCTSPELTADLQQRGLDPDTTRVLLDIQKVTAVCNSRVNRCPYNQNKLNY